MDRVRFLPLYLLFFILIQEFKYNLLYIYLKIMEEEKEQIVRRSISISKEMDEWLKAHPEVNCSALFRQSVYELQEGDMVRVSMNSLGFFILIAGCFMFILWFLLPTQLTGFLLLVLLSIVLVILVKSVILYGQYREDMKQWKMKDIILETEDLSNVKKQ